MTAARRHPYARRHGPRFSKSNSSPSGTATVVAVDRVDLSVAEGEIFGILGLNGAGKTTMVECAQGLRRPDAGSVRLLGRDPQRERSALAAACREPAPGLEPAGADARAARPSGCSPTGASRATRWRSGGSTRCGASRSARCRAASGSDCSSPWRSSTSPRSCSSTSSPRASTPSARRIVWDLVQRIRDRGTTVVLVTHFTDEAEVLCDRVVVMRDGRSRRARFTGRARRTSTDPASGCRSPIRTPTRPISARSVASAPSASRAIVSSSAATAGCWPTSAPTWSKRAGLRGTPVPADLHVDEPSLEDAVLELIGRTAA